MRRQWRKEGLRLANGGGRGDLKGELGYKDEREREREREVGFYLFIIF